jgi:hypothetical protein
VAILDDHVEYNVWSKYKYLFGSYFQAITVMKEVVQVTRINQRKEVVLDRVPVSWLTRNVIVTMDGRVKKDTCILTIHCILHDQ